MSFAGFTVAMSRRAGLADPVHQDVPTHLLHLRQTLARRRHILALPAGGTSTQAWLFVFSLTIAVFVANLFDLYGVDLLALAVWEFRAANLVVFVGNRLIVAGAGLGTVLLYDPPYAIPFPWSATSG
jgi:hypothetical protein